MQPLLTKACSVAEQLVPGLTGQGLSNVLWAVASLTGSVPPHLLSATEAACLRRDLTKFGSVNLTLLVCAHAKAGSMRVELAVAMNNAVTRMLPSFSPENLCK